MNKDHLKKRVFAIIQIGSKVDVASTVFDIFISVTILTSISVLFLQTFESMHRYAALLSGVELATIMIFMIEYLLRLWTSDLLYPKEGKKRALRRFVFSFYGVVDLLTIVSYFGPLYFNGIVALRIIRVIRIMRLFRVNKRFDAFHIVATVLAEKKKQLLSSVCMIAMLMLAASLCMYGFEHSAQPDVFENGFSGIWWAMSTVLTVGYGDIYPITVGGKLAAIVIALLGVCIVAIPTGVISAGFVEYYSKLRGELGRETMQMVQKRAREKHKSANEYVLHLLYKDGEADAHEHASAQNGGNHDKKGKDQSRADRRPRDRRRKSDPDPVHDQHKNTGH